MSAESGLKTFRDSDGLWEGFDVMQVATPEGWRKNPKLVLDFYNERRKQALQAQPNSGHLTLAELQRNFKVSIITQNVDDLHERAGSNTVIHLHGELKKARSARDSDLVYDLPGWELKWGDTCELGSQLRPHIVWFGEMVPMMDTAIAICEEADVFLIVGTSLMVYPAASLIHFVKTETAIYLIDPNPPDISTLSMTIIPETATSGLERFKREILMY